MYKIIFFILIKLTLAQKMIVFPFKHVNEGKNKGITINDKEYNGTNYAIDYFSSQLYIEMDLGNPPQTVKVLLSGEDCGYCKGSIGRLHSVRSGTYRWRNRRDARILS